MIKVMPVFGTRPEAIKMAPVVRSLKDEHDIETVVTVTAQHREMLDQVLELFTINTDYDLDVMKEEQSLTEITVNVLQGLKDILSKEKPDLLLVHGDTSTTFTAALSAFYREIKIGHVEAGLRTYDKYSPYPEEMNRHLTGVLTDLHFAPTPLARENLLRENVSKRQIFVTGNTVIDALLQTVRKSYRFASPVLGNLNFDKRKVILLTAHRRENLGQPLINICQAVKTIVRGNREVEVVFPVHLNPAVRKIVEDVLQGEERVNLIEPLDYEPFANLMARSYLILTDSGGIQEEAPGLGKPVLVLRNTTERPEALKAGTVIKVGTDREEIVKQTTELLEDEAKYKGMAEAVNPYGDGKASPRIINRILFEFGLTPEPGNEFDREG